MKFLAKAIFIAVAVFVTLVVSAANINTTSDSLTGSSLILLLKNATDGTYFYAELPKTVSDLRTPAQLQSDTPENYSVVGSDTTGPLNESAIQSLNGYTNANLAAYLSGNTNDAITWTIMGSKSAPQATNGAAALAVTSTIDFLDTSPWFNQDTWTAANFFGSSFITDELNRGAWTNGQSTTNGWGSATANGVNAPVSFNGAGFENGAGLGQSQPVYLVATTGGEAANVYKTQGSLTLSADGVLSYSGSSSSSSSAPTTYSIAVTNSDGANVAIASSTATNVTNPNSATSFNFSANSGDNVSLSATKTGYTCSVTPASINPVIGNSSATVSCTANTYTVGGANTDGASVAISGSSITGQAATTSTPYSFNAKYGDVVTLTATKTGYTCTVAGSPVLLFAANITTANVSCTANTYTMGGSNTDGASVAISGSSITGQAATTANSYSFNAKSGDVVTLTATKTGYTCTVAGSPITVGIANVTTANVTCTANTYTISGTNTVAASSFDLASTLIGVNSVRCDRSACASAPVALARNFIASSLCFEPFGTTSTSAAVTHPSSSRMTEYIGLSGRNMACPARCTCAARGNCSRTTDHTACSPT